MNHDPPGRERLPPTIHPNQQNLSDGLYVRGSVWDLLLSDWLADTSNMFLISSLTTHVVCMLGGSEYYNTHEPLLLFLW